MSMVKDTNKRSRQGFWHLIDLTKNLKVRTTIMGKWAKKRAKHTIKDEIYNRLSKMFKAGNGRSRNVDKRNGVDREYIYSSKTYKTYHNECKRFAVWCRKTHPEVKHLKQCKQYVNEYLRSQIDSNKSAWTICTQKAALAKLFGVDYAAFIATPSRERRNIKRSRNSVSRDQNISPKTEHFLAVITSSTGLRRNELCKITGEALCFDSNGQPYLHIQKGTKGGKPRDVVILATTQEETEYVISLFKSAGKMKVVPKVSTAYDNHHYRAEYAKRLYQHYARTIDDIPRKDRYIMRKDRAGEILDKQAMRKVSTAMGHNRIDVIALNYLYH